MAFLIFNLREGLGTNEKMRQAVQAAVNAGDIMKGVYGDEANYSMYSSYTFKGVTDWYTDAGQRILQPEQHGSVQAAADGGRLRRRRPLPHPGRVR